MPKNQFYEIRCPNCRSTSHSYSKNDFKYTCIVCDTVYQKDNAGMIVQLSEYNKNKEKALIEVLRNEVLDSLGKTYNPNCKSNIFNKDSVLGAISRLKRIIPGDVRAIYFEHLVFRNQNPSKHYMNVLSKVSASTSQEIIELLPIIVHNSRIGEEKAIELIISKVHNKRRAQDLTRNLKDC